MAKGKNKGNNNAGCEGDKKENNESCEKFLNIVLKIDLHCDGCSQKIRKHILSFPGVLKVEFEGESKVKIMAEKSVDPSKLKEKLQKKTLKLTEVVSPQPPKKEEKKNENKDKNQPKEAPVITAMLKVTVHCEGCSERLYKTITSYKGVHEVVIDKEKDSVKVTGRFDAKKMVEELQKKLKKSVEIANDKKGKDKGNEKKDGNEEKGKKEDKDNQPKEVKLEYLVNGSGYVGICDGSGRVLQIFDTPQFLSDENPNACSIM